MKKLVLMFVAVAAISLVSCGNKTNRGTVIDSDTIVITASYDSDRNSANDSTKNDSTMVVNDYSALQN